MDGLLRRKLARGEDSAGVCPEPDILAAYFERSLNDDEIERHELHFSRCARCREQLAAMARSSAPAGARAEVSSSASPWAWLGDWRWLALPAAAMLAFAIVGFLHERSLRNVARQAPGSPPVALTQPEMQPSGNLEARQDDKKSEALAAPSAQKNSGALSTGAHAIVPQMAVRKALSPNPSVDSALGERAAAKTADEDKVTDTLAKAEVRQEPLHTPAKIDAPSSVNQTVEVTAAAPVVPTVAPPENSARVAAGAAKGANESAGRAAPPDTGANTLELEAAAPRKKSKQEVDAGAAKSEITNSRTFSAAQSLTVVGKASSQMILTPDPAVLWRFAGSGFVERSTDGGATWQGEEPSAGGQLVAGAAPSANVCWIVGRDGLILLTKDAKSWKKIPPPVETDFVAVSAESAPSATITTADGRKFATKDGGKKWKPAETAANPPQN